MTRQRARRGPDLSCWGFHQRRRFVHFGIGIGIWIAIAYATAIERWFIHGVVALGEFRNHIKPIMAKCRRALFSSRPAATAMPIPARRMQTSHLPIEKTTATLSSRVISTAAICARFPVQESSRIEVGEGIKKIGSCRDAQHVSAYGFHPDRMGYVIMRIAVYIARSGLLCAYSV